MNYTYELWLTNALLHKIALVFSNCSLDMVQTKAALLFNQNSTDYMIVNQSTGKAMWLLATPETQELRNSMKKNHDH